jgi:hypothetical protein
LFDSQQKYTGTRYTMTVTLLIVAFIMSPVALMASRPLGYVSVGLALACSVVCSAMAWFNWRNHSELTIPSIVARKSRAK